MSLSTQRPTLKTAGNVAPKSVQGRQVIARALATIEGLAGMAQATEAKQAYMTRPL